MKRIFADLHLCLNLRELEQTAHIIRKTSQLGYRLIAVPFLSNVPEEKLAQLQSLCSEVDVDFVSRIDLKPKTPKELLNSLRNFRRRFEIVAVMCDSKSVARQAAKDRRVDLLNFPSIDFRKRFFDKAEAELASKSFASLEIDLKPLLIMEGPVRTRLLSYLRREIAIAQEFHVPIVLSSGVSEELLLRKPRELASLASLFDLDVSSAIKAVSENPVAIVRRNREKLDSRFVAPGIRVIRRGKDCEEM